MGVLVLIISESFTLTQNYVIDEVVSVDLWIYEYHQGSLGVLCKPQREEISIIKSS